MAPTANRRRSASIAPAAPILRTSAQPTRPRRRLTLTEPPPSNRLMRPAHRTRGGAQQHGDTLTAHISVTEDREERTANSSEPEAATPVAAGAGRPPSHARGAKLGKGRANRAVGAARKSGPGNRWMRHRESHSGPCRRAPPAAHERSADAAEHSCRAARPDSTSIVVFRAVVPCWPPPSPPPQSLSTRWERAGEQGG